MMKILQDFDDILNRGCFRMTAINFKLITRVRKQPVTWDGCRDVYSIKDTLQGGGGRK